MASKSTTKSKAGILKKRTTEKSINYAEITLNYICKFLQYDVMTLLRPKSQTATKSTEVSNDDNIILYDYGPKLKIYRGSCTNRRHNIENDIDMTDLTNSDTDDDCSIGNVQSTDEPYIDNSKTERSNNCQNMLSNWFHNMFTKVCSKSTQNILDDQAKDLYQNSQENKGKSNWKNLKNWQKLEFYWRALSKEVLSEEPFENFKRFYATNFPRTKESPKKYCERVLIAWHSLNTKKKLPFIQEALMAKIAAGKVNFSDEHELQRAVQLLYNRC